MSSTQLKGDRRGTGEGGRGWESTPLNLAGSQLEPRKKITSIWGGASDLLSQTRSVRRSLPSRARHRHAPPRRVFDYAQELFTVDLFCTHLLHSALLVMVNPFCPRSRSRLARAGQDREGYRMPLGLFPALQTPVDSRGKEAVSVRESHLELDSPSPSVSDGSERMRQEMCIDQTLRDLQTGRTRLESEGDCSNPAQSHCRRVARIPAAAPFPTGGDQLLWPDAFLRCRSEWPLS